MMSKKRESNIKRGSKKKSILGKSVAFSLCPLMALASTPLLAMHSPEQQNNNSKVFANNTEVGTNIYLKGLEYIGTQSFTRKSPGGHTEIITKVSSYYNTSAHYIIYCMETIVDAMNGSNIEAGKTAIGSGSTIFQSMYNPGTLFKHTTWVKKCHWVYHYNHWAKVCVECPETTTTVENGNLTPNVPGTKFSPSSNSHGSVIGSGTQSCTLSIGVSLNGVSAGESIGFSETTYYYSSKIYVVGCHSSAIQWKKDDCVKGLTYTHFITMASTFYAAGGNPFIYVQSIANTTYGGHFVRYWPFSAPNNSTLILTEKYTAFQ